MYFFKKLFKWYIAYLSQVYVKFNLLVLIINIYFQYNLVSFSEFTKPPFVVRESGYGNFEIVVDIFFKGFNVKDPARKTQLQVEKSNNWISKLLLEIFDQNWWFFCQLKTKLGLVFVHLRRLFVSNSNIKTHFGYFSFLLKFIIVQC